MKSNESKTYIAFLRGINVGGHHKVPMADLREILTNLELTNVVTLLNSGNIIFSSTINDIVQLEKLIATTLEDKFNFPIPTLIRTAETINQLYQSKPFQKVKITKDIRLYVSFLKNDSIPNLELPWISEDHSFTILELRDKAIISVLDLSVSKTPKAMNALEQFYGKAITTRNWKTIERIVKKMQS